MYAARVENLRPGTFVGVICDGCGHATDVASETIQNLVPGSFFVNKAWAKAPVREMWRPGKGDRERARALGYA
jgi:hypothetical protein